MLMFVVIFMLFHFKLQICAYWKKLNKILVKARNMDKSSTIFVPANSFIL